LRSSRRYDVVWPMSQRDIEAMERVRDYPNCRLNAGWICSIDRRKNKGNAFGARLDNDVPESCTREQVERSPAPGVLGADKMEVWR
jgi:hypothetical protein